MKKISVLIPCYNEEENIKQITKAVEEELKKLKEYDYEIVFIDNDSQDKTRSLIKEICKKNKKVKAIFNVKNFGQFNSPYYGLMQTTGDCTILICADFQDPVDMIPKFVKEWENGYKIVIGIKNKSKENKIKYLIRTCYYKIIKKFSTVEQIEHFTGFGLYDKDFINILRSLDDSQPYLRGIVSELGYARKEIPYTQAKRKNGKSKNNWYSLYDAGMVGITSYTKGIMRLATISGFIFSFISFLIGLIYLIMKLIYWDIFLAGIAPVLIGLFFMGSILLFFIGFLGEYILNMNSRLMKRPLVIEEERINFK
jgi:glycosyltransferase involved in cell wall biosynthesis